MTNLIIHIVSLMFAMACIFMTAMGIAATFMLGQWLEFAWGVAAHGMSWWLYYRLAAKCEELLDNLM